MNRINNLQRWIIFAVLCALLFSPTLPGRAQQPQQTQTPPTITGTVNGSAAFTITFPPAGGPVTGTFDYQGGIYRNDDTGEICTGSINISMSGTFTGGDGGAASGTVLYQLRLDNSDPCPKQMEGDYNGTWSGIFYASGTGNGTTQMENNAYGYFQENPWSWQVTYSAADFAAAVKPTVTKEYIQTTYHIKLDNNNPWLEGQTKDWTDHELSLLNDVLSQLPLALLQKMALASILRSDVRINGNGEPEPGVSGGYLRSGDGTVLIYNNASTLIDFNDPDTQFKAAILHEFTHSLQYYQDGSELYGNPYKSPLVNNYIAATRPTDSSPLNIPGNGWTWSEGKWQHSSSPGNNPPTEYGKKAPVDDMSESVMMYVYDPQRLKSSSQQRFNFIKEKLFGGIEYDNGFQKKP